MPLPFRPLALLRPTSVVFAASPRPTVDGERLCCYPLRPQLLPWLRDRSPRPKASLPRVPNGGDRGRVQAHPQLLGERGHQHPAKSDRKKRHGLHASVVRKGCWRQSGTWYRRFSRRRKRPRHGWAARMSSWISIRPSPSTPRHLGGHWSHRRQVKGAPSAKAAASAAARAAARCCSMCSARTFRAAAGRFTAVSAFPFPDARPVAL